MKILSVDIGTGTQDIFLYDSNLDIENGFKLVLPSPTMMVHRRLKQSLSSLRTSQPTPILLTGHQMGGGPSAWAIEEVARAGFPVYMTPSAATTLNDELGKVEALGIKIVGEDDAKRLTSKVEHLELRDFDFKLIAKTFNDYGVSLGDLSAIAVAVFDHGNAPAGVSDRQFRFDYLDERIKAENSLSAFAYLSDDIPRIMTRLQSVADSADGLPCPLVVMDTAPAAVLGAGFDTVVAKRKRKIICNVGNFHTLAFRLGEKGIDEVSEHHTGEIDVAKLESLLRSLADSSLKHEDVFNDMGHGALMYSRDRFEFDKDEFDVIVTGPRRSMFNHQPETLSPHTGVENRKSLRPYFAVPFGDMMIAGCFGLLAATADIMPNLAESIYGSLKGERGMGSRRGTICHKGVGIMNQHLHIITLGVRDFEISKKFYAETLGWKISRPQEGIAFFQAGGVVLAIYPREKVAEDALISSEEGGFSGMTLAYNARSETEVDEIISDLRSKGVKIVKEPQKVFWGGYSSYFADPDDYRWEVAYNPFFSFDENGNLKLD